MKDCLAGAGDLVAAYTDSEGIPTFEEDWYMDAIITIDGEDLVVKTNEPPSPRSQMIFDGIRKKHLPQGDGGVSAIIRNNLERKRLLGQLNRDGMARWVSDGSKAQFDKLVKEAMERMSAASI